jgi:hypothetical protein
MAALALLARLDPAGLTVGALTGAGDNAARAVHCVVQVCYTLCTLTCIQHSLYAALA